MLLPNKERDQDDDDRQEKNWQCKIGREERACNGVSRANRNTKDLDGFADWLPESIEGG